MYKMKKLVYPVVCVLGLTGCWGHKKEYDPISQVVTAPVKTDARVLGIVVSEPGLYDGFLDKGFGLSGQSGGIFVKTDKIESFNRGDQVEVEGVVADLYSMTVLQAKTVTLISDKQGIKPQITELGSSSLNKSHIGKLIRLQGKMEKMIPELPYGWRLQVISDAGQNVKVMISSTSQIEPRGDVRYTKSAAVTIIGFGVAFKDEMFILPRDSQDIVFL
tara:strand:- start:888 stop:1541 length:654 start_codon:yes stop_codon:yes gene_type:complete